MNGDLELEEWRSLWQGDTEAPGGLREKAARQARRMKMMLFADVVVTVLMGGGSVALWPLASNQPSLRGLAIWVWGTLLLAWIFRFLNKGGNWTGKAPDTELFLEELVKQYRVSLRNVKFGWGLGIVQLGFCSTWVYRELSRRDPITIWQFLTLKANLAAWVGIGILFAWSVRFFRKLKLEMACVERLRRDWEGGVDSADEEGEREAGRSFSSYTSGILGQLTWRLRRTKKKCGI